MDLLPTTLGTRPRLAIEIRPEGVVAARSEDAQALVSAVSYGLFEEGIVVPGLKLGNILGRRDAVLAIRRALEAVALKERQTTLVLPDAAVRVLLLDFDQLPAKAAEALPVVRFRLKKLLPFDSDDAVVSYQVMSTSRNVVRVLAVAVPKDVLAEYESLVREAGFEPGAVLPSTLAACAGITETDTATLLVNAGETSVTTAIVQNGVLLLHRTVDLAAEGLHEAAHPEELSSLEIAVPPELLALPLVDVHDTASEWARQEPVTGYGVLDDDHISAGNVRETERVLGQDRLLEDSDELWPPLPAAATQPIQIEERRMSAASREVTQAVSVAAAYYEDTLQVAPGVVLAAGTMPADVLANLLRETGFTDSQIRVREMMEAVMLTGGAVSARVPRGWIAGVRGALRS